MRIHAREKSSPTMSKRLKYWQLATVFGILVVTTVLSLKRERPCPSAAATRGGAHFRTPIALPVPVYRQSDPEWALERMGCAGTNLSRSGCVVTCVAMVFAYYGIETTPGTLNAFLSARGGYTDRGWLIWHQAAAFTGGHVHVAYVGPPDQGLVDANLRRHNPVIVKVLVAGGGAHWVVIVGKHGREYLINDPSRPERARRLLSEYGTHMYALRVFECGPV